MSLQYDPKTGRMIDSNAPVTPYQMAEFWTTPITQAPTTQTVNPWSTPGSILDMNLNPLAPVTPPPITPTVPPQPGGASVPSSGYTRDAQGNVFNAQGVPVSYESLPKGADGRPLMNLTTLPLKGGTAPVVPVIPPKFTATGLERSVGSTVADTQAKYDAKVAAIQKGYADQLAGMMPTEGEIARRARLTNLQEAQTRNIEDVQNRSLDGAILRSGADSEIANIQAGNTFASMPNLREQRLLTLQLGNDLATRQIAVDKAKVAIDAGQADYNMFRDYQKTVLDFEAKVQERNDALPERQKKYIGSITTQYGGLEWNDLDGQTKANLTDIAGKLGIPVQAIQTNLKNEKNKIQLDEANKRSEIAARNKTSGTSSSQQKIVDTFNKSLATWNKEGTREELIKQLQLMYGYSANNPNGINVDDIARKVYEQYGDNYNK